MLLELDTASLVFYFLVAGVAHIALEATSEAKILLTIDNSKHQQATKP